MERIKIDKSVPLDWMNPEYDLVKKASVIGDLGESNLLSARLKEAQSEDKLQHYYEKMDDPALFSCSSPIIPAPIPVQPDEQKTQSPDPSRSPPPM